jgi:hypothetical protein
MATDLILTGLGWLLAAGSAGLRLREIHTDRVTGGVGFAVRSAG